MQKRLPGANVDGGGGGGEVGLFVDELPEHEGGVGAAYGHDVLVVVEEARAGQQRAVDLLLDVLGLGRGARVPEEPEVALGVAAHEHVVGGRAARGRHHRRQGVVTIVPHSWKQTRAVRELLLGCLVCFERLLFLPTGFYFFL